MKAYFSQIGIFLLAGLVLFVVYRRFRRSFGQQPLRPVPMRVRSVILLLVGCFLLPVALRSMAFAGALLAGVTAGILLALWGAARTRFVRIADKLYYVPHTYTGIAVSLLFLGRLAYRLIQTYGSMRANSGGSGATDAAFAPAAMVRSPLTVGLFFVLMSYYVCYYSIVLWKSKRVALQEVGSAEAPLPTDAGTG
jgi:hypothetical protein